MKKTVAYIRQSLNDNKQKYSLDMQKGYCLDYASKNKWILHEIYNEGSRSARKTAKEGRPVLSNLLEEIKGGKVARVLVFKRDRLARNVQQYIEIIREFKKYEVELYFTADDEPQLFTGAISEFIEVLLAGIAKHEGDNIVSRLIQSKIQKIKEGKWAGGSTPFAYTLKGDEERGELIVDESKRKYVERVYQTFNEISLTAYKPTHKYIVNEMKKDLYFKNLKSELLLKIITHPLHKGELVQRLDGTTYSPVFNEDWKIVEPDVWKDANDFLATLKIPKSVLTKEEEEECTPLFSGLLVCTKCNQKLKTITKVYKCKTKDCQYQLKIEYFDEEVLDRIITCLKKKGVHEWEELSAVLERKYAQPFKKIANQLLKEIRQLEIDIKEYFKMFVETDEKESLVNCLVEKYKEKTAEYEIALSRYNHVSSFISELDKNDILATFTKDDLSYLQRQHLVKLVSEIKVGKKKIEEVSLYSVSGGSH